MTTIAYRDGVIAADSQITFENRRDGKTLKIRRLGRILAGAAGSASQCVAFLDWLQRGAPGHPPRLFSNEYRLDAFVVLTGGRIMAFNGEAMLHFRSDLMAIGSGAAYALGAMACGATAAEAVAVAAKFDINTGGEISVLGLDT